MTLLKAKGMLPETLGSALICLLVAPAELALEGMPHLAHQEKLDKIRG